MMDAARKRAQRRALYLAKRRGDPQQSIQVVGSRCRTYPDDGFYQATQDQKGLFWRGGFASCQSRDGSKKCCSVWIRQMASRSATGCQKFIFTSEFVYEGETVAEMAA